MNPSGASRRGDLAMGALSALVLLGALTGTLDGGAVRWPGGLRPMGACWLHAATGVACPFCGLTRSVVATAHGDLAAAFGFHVAGPAWLAGFALIAAVVPSLWLAGGRPLLGRRRFRRAVEIVALATGLVGAVRWFS